MANMAWNSAMNTAETVGMLTDKDAVTGAYRIPHIIYADAFYSEMVAYADLVLPDTTYLERWDCMSLLDRPISDADGPADSIRQPVLPPDRDVRPFQDVLLELGLRLQLPGLVTGDGGARFPGGYPDYLVNHERRPGIGSLAGWRGREGGAEGRGAPNPDQLRAYVDNGCFWRQALEPAQRYFKHVNRDYLDYAAQMGFIEEARPIIHQLYSEELQSFRLAARGQGDVQPPVHHRSRVEAYFDPLPMWYPPFEDSLHSEEDYLLHAITQRPMAMYHSWGSHNAWLRQIHGSNPLYVARTTAEELDLVDGDWVWVESRNGRIRVQVRLMDGLNPNTVWTWNAIGKRAGAWNLAPDSSEARQGFIINNLIDDLLPARENGYRYANADPVTGQAAWYDLRVRISKAPPAEAGEIAPVMPAVAVPPGLGPPPAELRYGAQFRKDER